MKMMMNQIKRQALEKIIIKKKNEPQQGKSTLRPNKKYVCLGIILPYLIFLVKPSNFFFMFSQKKSVPGIKYLC